jgi:hypothetical protein
MSAISNLKKAHQAQSITADTYSLQEYHAKFADKEKIARMNVVGIESKYVPKYDKRNAPETVDGAGNMGFRTRFILADGETIGNMSNAAHDLFAFFADKMGYTGEERFVHLDITGNVLIDVSVLKLDAKRFTYNFELIEEGSLFEGMADYSPTLGQILLESPSQGLLEFDPATGEIIDDSEPQEETSGKKK